MEPISNFCCGAGLKELNAYQIFPLKNYKINWMYMLDPFKHLNSEARKSIMITNINE